MQGTFLLRCKRLHRFDEVRNQIGTTLVLFTTSDQPALVLSSALYSEL